jgi:hypothetical protein
MAAPRLAAGALLAAAAHLLAAPAAAQFPEPVKPRGDDPFFLPPGAPDDPRVAPARPNDTPPPTSTAGASRSAAPSEPPAVEPPPPADAARLGPKFSSWQIDGTVTGGVYFISESAIDLDGARASASLAVTRFLKPVLRDDAPISLQPFLQRAGSVSLSLIGGGFVTDDPFARDRTDLYVGPRLGADVYLAHFLALTASGSYYFDALDDVGVRQRTHGLAASAGVGLRIRDVRLDVAYTARDNDIDGTFETYRWGPVSATLFAVFDRRLALTLAGSAFEGGGSASATAGYYATNRLGLFLSGGGEAGGHYVGGVHHDQVYGNAGIQYWAAGVVRVGVSYTLTHNHVPRQPEFMNPADELTNALEVGVSVRF